MSRQRPAAWCCYRWPPAPPSWGTDTTTTLPPQRWSWAPPTPGPLNPNLLFSQIPRWLIFSCRCDTHWVKQYFRSLVPYSSPLATIPAVVNRTIVNHTLSTWNILAPYELTIISLPHFSEGKLRCGSHQLTFTLGETVLGSDQGFYSNPPLPASVPVTHRRAPTPPAPITPNAFTRQPESTNFNPTLLLLMSFFTLPLLLVSFPPVCKDTGFLFLTYLLVYSFRTLTGRLWVLYTHFLKCSLSLSLSFITQTPLFPQCYRVDTAEFHSFTSRSLQIYVHNISPSTSPPSPSLAVLCSVFTTHLAALRTLHARSSLRTIFLREHTFSRPSPRSLQADNFRNFIS